MKTNKVIAKKNEETQLTWEENKSLEGFRIYRYIYVSVRYYHCQATSKESRPTTF
jgi:hypothetical protein